MIRLPRRRIHELRSREDGFTLIELMVAMVILGLLFAAFSGLIASSLNDSGQITAESVLQTQVRAAVDELVADVRQAYPNSTSATSPFVTSGGQMSSSSLTFYSPDRSYSSGSPTAFALREISYQLSGGNLQRALAVSTNTTGPPWTIPALGSWVTQVGSIVNTNIFSYYDDNGAATTTPASVASVVVTLTIQPAAGAQFTYSGTAVLRVSA